MLYYLHCMKELAQHFFLNPQDRKQLFYEALRASFLEGLSDKEVCERYQLKFNSFRSFKRDFLTLLKGDENPARLFFQESRVGKREKPEPNLVDKIINLRRKNLSVPDIKAFLSTQGVRVSLWKIDKILKAHHFPPLPRRTQYARQQIQVPEEFEAPVSYPLEFPLTEQFESLNGSLFLFCPLLQELELEKLVDEAGYPQSDQIPRLSAILSFLALKLINTRRLAHSNDYGLDRGLGLFAGLNVLPKNAWFASYSYRVSREMNRRFLASLNRKVEALLPASGDFNLDFTTIPHWGDESVLERNWSGTRRVGLKSVLALLVQDQNNRLLKYGDAEIKHHHQSEAILEFIDFYQAQPGLSDGARQTGKINCLIFDSKFTTYRHLNQLNQDKIKFLTLRRRSTKLIDEVEALEPAQWQKIHLNKSFRRKHRQLLVYESRIRIKDYDAELRQIVVKSKGRDKPAFIITNDFDISIYQVVIKYARRWLVEQAISEQVEFYHLNRLNSSIVVKVDFDLTMSILADTVYKLFSRQIPGFENSKSEKIYRFFVKNYAHFIIGNLSTKMERKRQNRIKMVLNKKVHLPLLYETDWFDKETPISWLGEYKISFQIGSSL